VADGLPVDGDHRQTGDPVQVGHPGPGAGVGRAGVEEAEQPVERVVRRDAIREPQVRLQPGVLGPPPEGHVLPRLTPADHGAQGDDDHIHRVVPAEVRPAGVIQVLEVDGNAQTGRRLVHESHPGRRAGRDGVLRRQLAGDQPAPDGADAASYAKPAELCVSPGHAPGANFAFADGSCRFISYSRAEIMPALATRPEGKSLLRSIELGDLCQRRSVLQPPGRCRQKRPPARTPTRNGH
jgi:prepilin-type processing-associated H-X9-DG protein